MNADAFTPSDLPARSSEHAPYSAKPIDAVGDAFGLTVGERRMLLGARTGTGLLISGTNRTAFEAVSSAAEHALATTGLEFTDSEVF